MNPKEEILKLKDGEVWVWPESDYGKCEVWKKHEYFILFAIPLYGGMPYFYCGYLIENIDKLIEEVESWT